MGEIPDSIKTAAAGTESGGGKQEGHYDCPGEEGRKLGRGVLTGCDDMTGGDRASNECYPKVPEDFTITERAPSRI